MTATTNGASLEDCLTNIFSLIDLNGIRWKRFKHKESNDIHDTHPVLTTYAKCIEENHIAVWRRHNQPGAGGGGGGGGGGGSCGNNLELWIFGYSNNFKVDDVVGSDLVEIEDDSWEQKGLSYECRTLLFKALHNLIERCMILEGFTRVGRWFVQPHTQEQQSSSSSSATRSSSNSSPYFTSSLDRTKSSLSFSFSFFVHGDSTICATVDVRQHPLIYPITRADLASVEAGGIVRVALAPYGLNGILNGVNYKDSENGAATTTFIQQWSKYYPLPKTSARLVPINKFAQTGASTTTTTNTASTGTSATKAQGNSETQGPRSCLSNLTNMLLPPSAKATVHFNHEPHEVPPVVEVIVAGHRMRYPSECVFTTTRVVDLYKTANHLESSKSSLTAPHPKRLNKSMTATMGATMTNTPPKPNKLSMLSEMLSDDKSTSSSSKDRVSSDQLNNNSNNSTSKNQSKFSSPFSLPSSTTISPSSASAASKTSGDPSMQQKSTFTGTRDNGNSGGGISDPSGESGPNSNTSTHTTTSRYNSSISSYNSTYNNATTTMPGVDLLKLFPTPPSLEQMIVSPSTGVMDEASAAHMTKDLVPPSPAGNLEVARDNGINIYKPVQCAAMPPPPKWEADKHIIINALPPQCIYRGSSQKANGKSLASQLTKESTHYNIVTNNSSSMTGNSFSHGQTQQKQHHQQQQLASALHNKSDSCLNSPATPLTDQTNKKGFNMNPMTPKSLLSNTMLNSPAASNAPIFSPMSVTATSNASAAVAPVTLGTNHHHHNHHTHQHHHHAITTLPAYTLPHQRFFSNLNEINSLQLNLLMSDSHSGMFLDHNFESCTLCVCNMSIKGTAPDVLPAQRTEAQNPWRNPLDGPMTTGTGGNGTHEYTNECTCGFSAMTNRHLSHLAGLFLEDELEITNVLYDPAEMIDRDKLFRKIRLSSYTDETMSEEQKTIARLTAMNVKSEGGGGGGKSNLQEDPAVAAGKMLTASGIKQERGIKDEKSSQQHGNSMLEETKLFVLDQIKQQCSTMIHSNSSLAKVLMIESFRNNRHLTSCINYYAQATAATTNNRTSTTTPHSTFHKLLDDVHKYTQVKMINRNPCSLRFSDYCEMTKAIIVKLASQSHSQQNSRMAGSPLETHPGGVVGGGGGPGGGSASNNLANILCKMFSPTRHQLLGKPLDPHAASRTNLFAQGLQALVLPTLTVDPKGALKMLEQLVKDDTKEALATLNKAILIFSSPVHDWQFLTTPIPENNFEVVNVLRLLQPSIESAVGSHNRSYKDFIHQQQQHIFSSRDSPTCEPVKPTPPCQGPLTWRQFHQTSANDSEDQCEPQPIPSLLTSYHVDRSHIAVSPFALKFWDKLLLEPYAPGHSVFYIVLAPDSPNITGHVKSYFEELGNTYELMKMGKHTPIGKGIVSAPFLASDTKSSDTAKDGGASATSDDWFSLLDFAEVDQMTNNIITLLRSYAKQLDGELVKTMSEFIDMHQPLYDPHSDRFESSPGPHETGRLSKPTRPPQHPPFSGPFSSVLRGELSSDSASAMRQHPLTADMVAAGATGVGWPGTPAAPSNDLQTFIDPNTGLQTQIKSQILINTNTGTHAPSSENTYMEDEPNKQTGVVIYIIDPFTLPSLSQNQRSLAIIGLMKCYSVLFQQLPENLKRVTQLQLISLDSIISHARPITELSRVDQLKSISMNIYSQCRKVLTNHLTAKSLTGFGPAAALDKFFKTKSPEICVTKMFTPPFMLAPLKDKQTELGEMFGDRREKSSVLFCSYCITEDQRWLLASVTNDKGEMSESTVINISVPDRLKRPKTSVKRMALRRLMDFIVSIMSEWATPWRLIIGKLGRVGHGELKEWAALMSKRSLLNYSRHLTERCRQCSVIPPSETVAILSACLVSLEPDSRLRVMPGQFANDDRQASFNKCPLSTPEDASVTHIMVFPTSASIQSTQGNVEDPLMNSSLDDDLLNQFPLDEGMEDLGVEENMDDLFSGAWDDPNPSNVNDHISAHNDPLASSSHPQGLGSVSGVDNADGQDETLQLLQQPLALGYYISTARIGQMPNWFWSTCPHLRNTCPVFLKSALHIHLPCVQLSDDLLHGGQSRKSHQLDSNLTTDILRYVLEGYNSLSWLALNPKSFDRQSCLPVHMQNLLQLYHLVESFS